MFKRIASLAVLITIFSFGIESVRAGLITTHTDNQAGGATVDGTISANEYGPGNSYVYTGFGSGFGFPTGPLGNGALYMNSSNTKLYIGMHVANNLNGNIIAVFLDTEPGGFTDAQMNDTADAGRNIASNLSGNTDDVFPAGFLPDVVVEFGNGFTNFFGLTAGSLDYLPNIAGTGTQAAGFGGGVSDHEAAINLTALGINQLPSNVNFFVGLFSDTNFTSDETIPSQPFSGQGNPGFGTPTAPLNWPNYDQFVVPEPGSIMLLAIGGLSLLRRTRRA